MSFNPLKYSLCFMEPRRLNIKPWSELIPFAFALIQLVKPKIFVELGTNTGESYCAFCQAIDVLKLNTVCCAVDTWQGDSHTGPYGEEILIDLRHHHDPLYGHFSTLIQNKFDNVVNNFQDGCIDLLHIDGFHSYEAVKHDFESWLPKVSSRGIVLFHDTHEHREGFGVWRFWDEAKSKYPNFEVEFGHGLGVLGVGDEFSEEIKILFESVGEDAVAISDFFHFLGKNNIQKKVLENEIAIIRQELKAQEPTAQESRIKEPQIGLLKKYERALRKKAIKPFKEYCSWHDKRKH